MRSIEPLAVIYRRWALARLLEWVDDEGESKTRGGFVDYVVNLHVDVGDEGAYAVASMECPSGAFKGEGRAKIGRSLGKQHIAGDLATARALRAIEADLMEHVHEGIDRCTDTP